MGARSVRQWHEEMHPERKDVHMAEVVLVCRGRSLSLAPYVSAEVCTRCGHRDVFLFDSTREAGLSRADDRGFKARFDLKDWPHGHPMTVASRAAPALAGELAEVRDDVVRWRTTEQAAFLAGFEDGGIRGRELTDLLDTLTFDARYLKPDFLYDLVERQMQARDRGILWLAMPAHTGKTMFARAIGDPMVDDSWRLKRLSPLVAAVYIRREMRFDAVSIGSRLKSALVDALGVSDNDRERIPALDTKPEPGARQAAFLAMLNGGLKYRNSKTRARRLLIATVAERSWNDHNHRRP